jgi:ferredoxin-NADP reductase
MVTSGWTTASVVDIRLETRSAKSFRFRLPGPSMHLPGQHYIVRLTAPDGYVAQRSYSVASAPDETSEIELTVERLPDGEVSSFLHDEVIVGDELELRGPIGGFFVWRGDAPALLIGGGSGVVPLMAMLRFARRNNLSHLVRLLVSVRRPGDLYYANELPGSESTVIYTREVPSDAVRAPGRLKSSDLEPQLLEGASVYVCGSASFADAATDAVEKLGVATGRIRVERFGATG